MKIYFSHHIFVSLPRCYLIWRFTWENCIAQFAGWVIGRSLNLRIPSKLFYSISFRLLDTSKGGKTFFSTFHHCFLIFFNFTFRTIFLFKFHDRSFIMQSLINNFSFRIFFDCPLIAFSFHFKSHYVIHKIRAGKFMNVMNSGSPFENFSNDEQTKYPLRCYHLRVRKPF